MRGHVENQRGESPMYPEFRDVYFCDCRIFLRKIRDRTRQGDRLQEN